VSGRCDEPAYVGPVVPAFPRTAGQASPAVPLPGNAATVLDRRVTTAAVRPVLVAEIAASDRAARPGGPGLRGGTFTYTPSGNATQFSFNGTRFVEDVTVTG
jgi:hypothetical protein